MLKEKQDYQKEFDKFHDKHPEILEHIKQLIKQVQQRGFHCYSINAIWEQLRWHLKMEKDTGQQYRLNAKYTAYYARKIMAEDEKLKGFFQLRRLRSKRYDEGCAD